MTSVDSDDPIDQLFLMDCPQVALVLSTLDRGELSGEQLGLVVAAEARLLAWVQAGMAASLSEFAQCPTIPGAPAGMRTGEWQEFAEQEVGLLLTLSPMTASNLVGQSDDVYRCHPRVWAAWRDGYLDHRKVAVITRVTQGASAQVKDRVDAALLNQFRRSAERKSAWELTVQQTPGFLQRRAHAALAAADPAWVARRQDQAVRGRRVSAGADRDTPGIGYLTGQGLPVEKVAAAYARINQMAKSLKAQGDARMLDQLRADVYLDLLMGVEVPGASGTGVTVELLVHADQVAADLTGFGFVPADVAERLVRLASEQPSDWCVSVIGPDGTIVRHARTRHDPTKGMRDYVNARDRHCRFPGCVHPADACDTDHTQAWESGGPTCPCNLAPLCRRHHRLKQADGWDLQIDADTNDATWTTPHLGKVTVPAWTPPTRHHDDPAPF